MRTVQALQCVAVATLLTIQLGHLARGLCGEKQILPLLGERRRLMERLFCGGVIPGLARDHTVALVRLPQCVRVLRLLRQGHREVARLPSATVLAAGDPVRGAVDLEQHPRWQIAKDLADLDRLVVCTFAGFPPLHARVQHPDVVQRRADVLGQAKGPVIRQACLVVTEGFLEIAADVGDDAEVLRCHRGELCLTRVARVVAGLQVELFSLVELPEPEVRDRLDVHRVADAGFVAASVRYGEGRLEAVKRGVEIRIELVGEADPPQQGRSRHRLRGVTQRVERALVQRARHVPPPLPFGKLPFVDERLYWRRHFVGRASERGKPVGRPGEPIRKGAHDAATVRRAARECGPILVQGSKLP
jgi:hypothetical protein